MSNPLNLVNAIIPNGHLFTRWGRMFRKVDDNDFGYVEVRLLASQNGKEPVILLAD